MILLMMMGVMGIIASVVLLILIYVQGQRILSLIERPARQIYPVEASVVSSPTSEFLGELSRRDIMQENLDQ